MENPQNTDSMDRKQLLRYAKDVSSLHKTLKEENKLLQKANKELQESIINTAFMGFDMINNLDNFLGGHCRRVSYYTHQLCKALELDKDETLNIKLAALIHDIGLLGVPEKKLKNMFAGRINSKHDIYQNHPLVEIRPITSNKNFGGISSIIRCHHENIDGSGFPNGLVGDKIPLGSKIISVINDYDEIKLLTRKALEPSKIISQIENNVESRYDPQIFQTFKELILEGDPLKNYEYINFGKLKVGMVLAQSLKTVIGPDLLKAETEITENHLQILQRFYDYDKMITPFKVYKQKN